MRFETLVSSQETLPTANHCRGNNESKRCHWRLRPVTDHIRQIQQTLHTKPNQRLWSEYGVCIKIDTVHCAYFYEVLRDDVVMIDH